MRFAEENDMVLIADEVYQVWQPLDRSPSSTELVVTWHTLTIALAQQQAWACICADKHLRSRQGIQQLQEDRAGAEE